MSQDGKIASWLPVVRNAKPKVKLADLLSTIIHAWTMPPNVLKDAQRPEDASKHSS